MQLLGKMFLESLGLVDLAFSYRISTINGSLESDAPQCQGKAEVAEPTGFPVIHVVIELWPQSSHSAFQLTSGACSWRNLSVVQASRSWAVSQRCTLNTFLALLLYRMDDMAVDSDEEVDYSKMDQVCCYELFRVSQ